MRTYTKNLANYMALPQNTLGNLASGADKIALHAWIRPAGFATVANGDNRIISGVMASASTALTVFVGDGSAAKLRIGGRSQSGDGFQVATSTTTLSMGTLYAVGGTLDIAGDAIKVYVNGTLETTQSVTFGATTYTHTTTSAGQDAVGSFLATNGAAPGATTVQFDGDIGEVCLWTFAASDALLTDAEFAALARGVSPFAVRPSLLRMYLPIYGSAGVVRDLTRGQVAPTMTGTLPAAAHPPVATPWGGSGGWRGVFKRSIRQRRTLGQRVGSRQAA